MEKYGNWFILGLGVLNIMLNTFAQKTAKSESTYISAIMSPMFALTFIIGILALLCMLGLYYSGIPLARGILLAGATSILLGTLWGWLIGGASPTLVEWLLWFSIAGFYAAKLLKQ